MASRGVVILPLPPPLAAPFRNDPPAAGVSFVVRAATA